ncbi:MAG: CBS domain-containing protein [Spirochaetia bacterium]|jgi:CBS domain-containing protein|nr:CBS domain-containing protein [Spirochaetia bacterium]
MNVGTYLDKKKGHDLFTIRENQKVRECIDTLNSKKVGALVVVDASGNLKGIVSERDVLRKGFANLDKNVSDIMTPASKTISAQKTDNILDVMKQFDDNKIRHLPVMDEGKPIGMVSIGDVVNELLQINIFENEQLKNYIISPY